MDGKSLRGSALVPVWLLLTSCAFDTSAPTEAGSPTEATVPDANGASQEQALVSAKCVLEGRDDCCDLAKYDACYTQGAVGTDFRVKIYRCLPSPTGAFHDQSCDVEPDWTLVGGGTNILDANPGEVVITENSPPQFENSWRSATHEVGGSHPHRLQGFAIGVKMKGYDRTSPDNYPPIKLSWSGWTMPLTERPHATVKVPYNHLLLGGGFEIDGPRGGIQKMYVVDAYATAMLNGTWVVNGSSLGQGWVESVQGFALSVDRCPARWSSCFSNRRFIRTDSTSGVGEQASYAINPYDGFFTTGVGFISSSWDRPVYRVMPLAYQQVNFGGGSAGTWSPDADGYVETQAITLAR